MAELSAGQRVICRTEALRDGGPGVRFEISTREGPGTAFVIRYRGQVYAYVNRCAHRFVELDWVEGEFFDSEGESLVCATHGARYHPATGACLSGPCKGGALEPVPVVEADGQLLLAGNDADENRTDG